MIVTRMTPSERSPEYIQDRLRAIEAVRARGGAPKDILTLRAALYWMPRHFEDAMSDDDLTREEADAIFEELKARGHAYRTPNSIQFRTSAVTTAGVAIQRRESLLGKILRPAVLGGILGVVAPLTLPWTYTVALSAAVAIGGYAAPADSWFRQFSIGAGLGSAIAVGAQLYTMGPQVVWDVAIGAAKEGLYQASWLNPQIAAHRLVAGALGSALGIPDPLQYVP